MTDRNPLQEAHERELRRTEPDEYELHTIVQLRRLRALQLKLWQMDRTSSVVVMGLGDVPELRLRGRGSTRVAVVAYTTPVEDRSEYAEYDVWLNGDLDEPDVDGDRAIERLLSGR